MAEHAAPASAETKADESQTSPPKIKPKKPGQRACDEKDEKGKLCCGHLKRWYDYPRELQSLVGKNAEIYRCEFCKTIYKPDPHELARSYTVRY
jgi:hypothetical protein